MVPDQRSSWECPLGLEDFSSHEERHSQKRARMPPSRLGLRSEGTAMDPGRGLLIPRLEV